MKRVRSLIQPVFLALSQALMLVSCPYSKVEEGFITNGLHDLRFAKAWSESTHMSSPDWVQRSSVPIYLLSSISDWVRIVLPNIDPSMLPRVVLGALMLGSFVFLASRLNKDSLILCIIASQFHLPFYSTRLLINSCGLVLANIGLGLYIRNRLYAIAWLVFSAFAVRLDLFPLAVGIGLDYLFSSNEADSLTVRFSKGVLAGIVGLLAAALISIPLDSLFWADGERIVWAEWTVIIFNVVQNQSHLWGTQPWRWYWTDALPRAIGFPILFLFYRRLWSEGTLRFFVATVVVPVSILSLLGHKELRFIFPSVVALTVVIAQLVRNLSSSKIKWMVWPLLLANSGIALVRLSASSMNYPGGEAWGAIQDVFLHGKHIPGVIFPTSTKYIPSMFLDIVPPNMELNGIAAESIPSSCSIFNGYLADTTGFTKYLTMHVPCVVKREGDTLMSGVDPISREERERFDVQVVAVEEGCNHPVSAVYGLDRVDVKRLRIMLKPVLYLCRRLDRT